MSADAARLETRDEGQVVSLLSHVLAPHRMERCEPGRELRARVQHGAIGRVTLTDLQYGTAVRIVSRVPEGRVLVHGVICGESGLTAPDGRAVPLRVGSVSVSPAGTPLSLRFNADSRHLTASLPASLWLGGTERLGARQSAAWLDLMRFLLGWSESGACGAAAHVEAMIGGFLADARPAPALPGYVVRARRLIANGVRDGVEAITLPQVAARAAVSPRTLQAGLRRFAGRSFGEEVRVCRLEALDRLLRESGGRDDVTQLMQRCGIVSMGRFAGYYREQFGVLPSGLRTK